MTVETLGTLRKHITDIERQLAEARAECGLDETHDAWTAETEKRIQAEQRAEAAEADARELWAEMEATNRLHFGIPHSTVEKHRDKYGRKT